MGVQHAFPHRLSQIALPLGPTGGVGHLVSLPAGHALPVAFPPSVERDDHSAMLPSREKLARELAGRSDADLLALTRKGERDAFAAFYLRHQQAILSYLAHYAGDVDVAADMASEVFAEALSSIDRYRPEKGVPRAWLFGIAKNTLLASYRRRGVERSARRKLGLSVDAFGEDVWEGVESRLDASVSGLVEGLERLSPTERDAVIARIVDERDYDEIAVATNSSEAAIRQRVSRGLSKLAKTMKWGER